MIKNKSYITKKVFKYLTATIVYRLLDKHFGVINIMEMLFKKETHMFILRMSTNIFMFTFLFSLLLLLSVMIFVRVKAGKDGFEDELNNLGDKIIDFVEYLNKYLPKDIARRKLTNN